MGEILFQKENIFFSFSFWCVEKGEDREKGQEVVTLKISPKATIFRTKSLKIYPMAPEQLMLQTSGAVLNQDNPGGIWVET